MRVGYLFQVPTMPLVSRPLRLRRLLTAAVCAVLVLLGLAAARAEAKWVVSGAGFGHGTGLSQYGAYGYAKQGVGYAEILAHYYTGTTLGTTANTTVRVLLLPNRPSVRFNGRLTPAGRSLSKARPVAKRKGTGVRLLDKRGGRIVAGPLLSATGGPDVNVVGKGSTAARSRFGQGKAAGKVNAINAVGVEDYVRGVVAKESPASWPPEALRAQGGRCPLLRAQHLQARGRLRPLRPPALGLRRGGRRDHEDQPGGRRHGRGGRPLPGQGRPTYFFSTSGGATENNENTAIGFGGTPIPYSRSPTPTTTSPPPTAGPGSSPRPRSRRSHGLVRGGRPGSSPRPASRRGSSGRGWSAPAAPGM